MSTSTIWMLAFHGNTLIIIGEAILIAFFLSLILVWVKSITL